MGREAGLRILKNDSKTGVAPSGNTGKKNEVIGWEGLKACPGFVGTDKAPRNPRHRKKACSAKKREEKQKTAADWKQPRSLTIWGVKANQTSKNRKRDTSQREPIRIGIQAVTLERQKEGKRGNCL